MLRERFAQATELSLLALTSRMTRKEAAQLFYQVCGAPPGSARSPAVLAWLLSCRELSSHSLLCGVPAWCASMERSFTTDLRRFPWLRVLANTKSAALL